MRIGPLAGYAVGVTADRRAEEQSTLLTRLGASVVHGPVIRTRPLAGSDGVRQATEELIAAPPEVLVLSTALGVRGWFGAAESLGLGDELLEALQPASVIARGPKASGAAVSLGLEVAWQSALARCSEIVAHLGADGPGALAPGTRVAVQLDGSPQPELADEIRKLGRDLDVVPVPVYRWELPEDPAPAHRLIAGIVDGTLDAVTFTSSHAVTNFATLAAGIGELETVRRAFTSGEVAAVAVGPVTAERLGTLNLARAVQPRTFRLGAMVQALAESLRGNQLELQLAGFDVLVQGRLVAVADQEPVHLTDRERAVLSALSHRPGVVVSKGELREQVWGNVADDHAVEVTVGRLRRRLGPAADGIETVMRRGYRLALT